MEPKEKIVVNKKTILELLEIVMEIKKKNPNQDDLAKAGEMCIKILGKKCLVKWHRRLRQRDVSGNKIIKKGLIYKIK